MGWVQGASGGPGARLWNLLGASNHLLTICSVSGAHGLNYTMGTTAGMDPEAVAGAGLVMIWGSNTLVTNRHFWPFVETARERGRPCRGHRSCPDPNGSGGRSPRVDPAGNRWCARARALPCRAGSGRSRRAFRRRSHARLGGLRRVARVVDRRPDGVGVRNRCVARRPAGRPDRRSSGPRREARARHAAPCSRRPGGQSSVVPGRDHRCLR